MFKLIIKIIKRLLFVVFLLFIFLLFGVYLFSTKERTNSEVGDFILSLQFNQEYPGVIVGEPLHKMTLWSEENLTQYANINTNIYEAHKLKLIQKEGGLFWVGWNEQRIIPIRSLVKINNFSRVNTLFVSLNGDVAVLIDHGRISSYHGYCGHFGTHNVPLDVKYTEFRILDNGNYELVYGNIKPLYTASIYKALCRNISSFNVKHKPSRYDKFKTWILN